MIVAQSAGYCLVRRSLAKLQLNLFGSAGVEIVGDCSSYHFNLLVYCGLRIILVMQVGPVNALRGEKSVDKLRPMGYILFSRVLNSVILANFTSHGFAMSIDTHRG